MLILNKRTPLVKWTEIFIEEKERYVSWNYTYYMKGLLCNHIKPYFRDKAICEISTLDINHLLYKLYQDNLSKKSLKSVKNLIKQTFDFATEMGIEVKNIAEKSKIPPKASKKSRRALTSEEIGEILQIKDKRIYGAILLMLFAGLRVGEIIPLKWEDISLYGRTVNVNKSVQKVGSNQYQVKEGTKNGENRKVSIPTTLIPIIFPYVEEGKYITSKIDSSMHTPSSWKRLWDTKVTKHRNFFGENPLSAVTPHMCRHTYATMLYSSGVDVLTASKLLGHSDIQTTLSIYTHLEEETYNSSVQKLEQKISLLIE